MKHPYLIWIVLFVGIVATIAILFGVALLWGRPMYVPELEQFVQRAKMIKAEMTNEQVDDILRDYPSHYVLEAWPVGGSDNLIRPSVVTKCYELSLRGGKTADEGDYFVDVYFDKDDLVVGTHLGEYIR